MIKNHQRKFFYLKKAQSKGINKGKCLIMLSYYCQDRRRFKNSTRIYVPSKAWNETSQKILSSYTGSVELNMILDKFVRSLVEITASMKADGIETSPEAINERYQALTKDRIKANHDKLFLPFFREVLGTKEKQGRLRRKLKNNTVKVYSMLLRLMEQEEKHLGTPLTFESFTQAYFIDFSERLQSSLGANTIRKRCSTLKTLLSMAVREGRTTFRGFEIARLDIKAQETIAVYLSEQELDRINNLRNVPEIANRKDAEILFREADRVVLGCWLGLRWSDFSRINKSNFYQRNGSWFMTLETQKTEESVVVPVHPMALEILKRYNFLPPKISQQKANTLVKRVCAVAGISEPVSTHAGVIPKYELVTTHSMRRSFATNLVNRGISHYHVMKLGGWKSFAAFEKYLRLSKEDAATEVANIFAGNASHLRKVG